MATDASGSLADTVTFSNWKGVAYMKLHQKPNQPNAPKQIAMRAIVNFLSIIWKQLPAADRASWTALAKEKNVSRLNACVGFNLERWRGFHYPATKLPADEVLLTQNWVEWTITGDIRHADHVLRATVHNDGRGWALHRWNTPGFTRRWSNLVHIVPYLEPETDYTWTDHVAPGTYWYNGVRISSDGRWQIAVTRGPVIVTA